MPPLIVLVDSPTHFYGDPQATTRSMSRPLDGPRQLGAGIDADSLPSTLVPGSMTGNSEVVMDSSASSQFISGLLLIGARLPFGFRLRHAGDSFPSRSHTVMTVEMLRTRGVHIDEPDARSWRVHGGPVLPLDVRVESDLTNASVSLAAGAATGGCVTIPGWPGSTFQSRAWLLDVAERMGCTTAHSGGAVAFSGPGRLRGIDVDLHDVLELTPVVAALAALAEGTTRITGIAHIRGHRTDRLSVLTTELRKLGVAVIEHHGGLETTGRPWGRGGVELSSYVNHCMAHSVVIVVLGRPGIDVDDFAYVPKTMPDFSRLWNQLMTT